MSSRLQRPPRGLHFPSAHRARRSGTYSIGGQCQEGKDPGLTCAWPGRQQTKDLACPLALAAAAAL